ncbi:MAG: hypothetical protein ACI9LM_001192 [Alteromonadaceae bacterium]|jgi:hypothetical protein
MQNTSGVVVTVVLSAIMIAKGMMGVMPEFNVAVMIGTIAWAPGFAAIYGMLPSNSVVVKRIVFGITASGLLGSIVPRRDLLLTYTGRRITPNRELAPYRFSNNSC